MKTKFLYALRLTKPGAKIARYQIYQIQTRVRLTAPKRGIETVLAVLWCENSHEDNPKKFKLLPCQVFYPLVGDGPDRFPAFHFVVGNVGYNKLNYLRGELQKVFKAPLSLEIIEGWAPSGASY